MKQNHTLNLDIDLSYVPSICLYLNLSAWIALKEKNKLFPKNKKTFFSWVSLLKFTVYSILSDRFFSHRGIIQTHLNMNKVGSSVLVRKFLSSVNKLWWRLQKWISLVMGEKNYSRSIISKFPLFLLQKFLQNHCISEIPQTPGMSSFVETR